MKWINANAGTMGMSLFLALLTWVYLWSTSSSTGDFRYEFKPIVRGAERLASVSYEVDGKDLHEGDTIPVKITGPRTEIERLRGSTPVCSPILEASSFTEPEGNITIDLLRDHFKLPDILRLEGAPGRIVVKYVKLVEVEVPILATADDIEGRVKPGFRVTRIVPQPDKVRMRVPADSAHAKGQSIPIQKVTVTNQSATFTAPGYVRLSAGMERVSTFELTVVIERRVDEPRVIPNVPVRLLAPEDVRDRLHLESPTAVDVEVRGPSEITKDLGANDFTVYVEVDLTKDTPPGKYPQRNLFCHLKKKVDAEIDIVIMPGVKPENLQAEVTVLPPK